MDFCGAKIANGAIFAGLPIACAATEGGRAYINEYCNEKVAQIMLLCRRLQSLDRLQGAYTILSRSISRKLVHLHAHKCNRASSGAKGLTRSFSPQSPA